MKALDDWPRVRRCLNKDALGQHFLVPRSRVDSAPRQLELVLNWFEELNRLAPK